MSVRGSMRRTATGPLVVGLVALALASGAGSATEGSWKRDAGAALEALERSVAAGLVSDADAGRYRAVLRRAAVVRARVPPLRREILGRVLAQIATYASPLAPRALALYSTLELNVDYLKRKRVPRSRLDVVGGDGTVYRAVAGKGLQFHPLANAVKLNGYALDGHAEAARGLADALAARALSRAGGVRVWEYPFDFGSVPAPWTSGMAQAVLAQALARAGQLLADPALLALARSAFRAVPRSLDRELPAGPWVELYSGSSLVVLNAQLQSAGRVTRQEPPSVATTWEALSHITFCHSFLGVCDLVVADLQEFLIFARHSSHSYPLYLGSDQAVAEPRGLQAAFGAFGPRTSVFGAVCTSRRCPCVTSRDRPRGSSRPGAGTRSHWPREPSLEAPLGEPAEHGTEERVAPGRLRERARIG